MIAIYFLITLRFIFLSFLSFNITERLFNYFFLRFCGEFDQVKWIAGWFSSNEGTTYDIHTNFIVNWKATETTIINPPSDTSFTTAVNNLSADKDTGRIGSTAYGAPNVDASSWGALFQNNDAIIYSTLKSSFGDRFMITFWMKLVALEYNPNLLSSKINLFYRKSASGLEKLRVSLIAKTQADILVSIKNTLADPHGAVGFQNGVFYRVLIVIYKNFNLYGGSTFFDIIVPPNFADKAIQS